MNASILYNKVSFIEQLFTYDGLKQTCCWKQFILSVIIGIIVTGCGDSNKTQEHQSSGTVEGIAQKIDEARTRLMRNKGGKLILRAITSHGGLKAWYRAPTSSYTWEYANVGADVQFKSFLVANNRTRQIYHELQTLGSYKDPEPIEARFARDGSDVWVSPPSIKKPNPRFWATAGYYFEQIPFVLADRGVNYSALPEDTLDGTTYDMVKVSYNSGVGDSPGDTYILYVNQESGIVDAIRYTVTYGRDPSNTDPQQETLFYYEDYVTVDSLTVAKHFRGYFYKNGERGGFKNEAWADSISFCILGTSCRFVCRLNNFVCLAATGTGRADRA